ncbi:MAG: RNA 2',3'-cyclic phosphodiesterase [Armatimonadota bacterium]
MDFDPNGTLRLFFGLKLSDEVRADVVALQLRLAAGRVKVKWVEPQNLHFTLKFLGEMPALIVPELKLIGEQVAAQRHPWALTLRGVGAFPKLHHPQAIYAATGDGAEDLVGLAGDLTRALAECQIAQEEKKPFVAHCTVGRVKQERGIGGLVAALEAETGFVAGPMQCERFALLSSTLTPAGPVYAEVADFAFPQRPDEPEQ